jgi:hypothetical protein
VVEGCEVGKIDWKPEWPECGDKGQMHQHRLLGRGVSWGRACSSGEESGYTLPPAPLLRSTTLICFGQKSSSFSVQDSRPLCLWVYGFKEHTVENTSHCWGCMQSR